VPAHRYLVDVTGDSSVQVGQRRPPMREGLAWRHVRAPGARDAPESALDPRARRLMARQA
jgi:hypothetical protein